MNGSAYARQVGKDENVRYEIQNTNTVGRLQYASWRNQTGCSGL